MVKNVCGANKYHKLSHFKTITCKHKKHFSTAPVKNYFESKAQMDIFSDYDTYFEAKLYEIDKYIKH